MPIPNLHLNTYLNRVNDRQRRPLTPRARSRFMVQLNNVGQWLLPRNQRIINQLFPIPSGEHDFVIRQDGEVYVISRAISDRATLDFRAMGGRAVPSTFRYGPLGQPNIVVQGRTRNIRNRRIRMATHGRSTHALLTAHLTYNAQDCQAGPDTVEKGANGPGESPHLAGSVRIDNGLPVAVICDSGHYRPDGADAHWRHNLIAMYLAGYLQDTTLVQTQGSRGSNWVEFDRNLRATNPVAPRSRRVRVTVPMGLMTIQALQQLQRDRAASILQRMFRKRHSR